MHCVPKATTFPVRRLKASSGDAERRRDDLTCTVVQPLSALEISYLNVVTSSRIACRPLKGAVSVAKISGEDTGRAGFRSMFDALTSFPQNTISLQSAGPTVFPWSSTTGPFLRMALSSTGWKIAF